MSAHRTYEAKSKNWNVQEAIDAARQLLNADLGEGGVNDATAAWTVTEISGSSGGWDRFIKVKITAIRSPEWAG